MEVKNLTVTVKYEVGIGGVDMPEEVYLQLLQANEEGIEIDGTGMENEEAVEWLRDNISERDCCDIKYEVEDIM